MKKAVETAVAVWTVLGWVVGSALVLIGFGRATYSVFESDGWGVVDGLTMIALGVLAVNIAWRASLFLVQTVGKATDE